ncbi:uncharacterized protein LOC134264468, partial [Saccostrea cucullata]|uniref:uncharacterized protein LOC134264468 n=1 Tax=Saccostrea cuccullata TaxID=36930 RepID=UPI002ED2B3BC
DMSLPLTLYIQADNSAKDNKNFILMGFLASLVQQQIVKKQWGWEQLSDGKGRRSVRFLEESRVVISQLVTDRHLQVAKWVRENMPNTVHNIDVWHVAKGLKKKLVALSKEKDCQDVVDWIKSITYHLYWVPSSTLADEEDEMKWEKWSSILNHIQNVHAGHGDHFERCEHGDLGPDTRLKDGLDLAPRSLRSLNQSLIPDR